MAAGYYKPVADLPGLFVPADIVREEDRIVPPGARPIEPHGANPDGLHPVGGLVHHRDPVGASQGGVGVLVGRREAVEFVVVGDRLNQRLSGRKDRGGEAGSPRRSMFPD